MKIPVIGLGAGGHAKVVIDALQQADDYELVGLLDPEDWTTLAVGQWETFEDYYNECLKYDPTFRMYTEEEYKTFKKLYDDKMRAREVVRCAGDGFKLDEIPEPDSVRALNWIQKWVLEEVLVGRENWEDDFLRREREMRPILLPKGSRGGKVFLTRDYDECQQTVGRLKENCKIDSTTPKIMEFPVGDNGGVFCMEFFTFTSLKQILTLASEIEDKRKETEENTIGAILQDVFMKLDKMRNEEMEYRSGSPKSENPLHSFDAVLDGGIFPLLVIVDVKLVVKGKSTGGRNKV